MSRALEGFAALSQETRLGLLRLLVAAGPGGVPAGEAARRLGVPPSTLSTHLAVLTRAGLATARREGRSIRYAPDLDGLRGLVGFLLRDCCGGEPGLCGLPDLLPPERAP